MKKSITLGCVARDTITGFEGVVIGHTIHISNCPRYAIQPTKMVGKKVVECRTFDETTLEFVKSTNHKVLPTERPSEPVGLGDIVKDELVGASGTVVAITAWSNGCSRIQLQPNGLKDDGTPADIISSDEKDLWIEKRATPKPQVKTGGPRPAPSRR